MGIIIDSYKQTNPNAPYFTDDFSTNNWNYTSAGSKLSYTSGQLNFATTGSDGHVYAYYDMGSSIGIGNVNWYMDYTYTCSSFTKSGNTAGIAVGIGETLPSSVNNGYYLEWGTDPNPYPQFSYGYANATFGDLGYAWAVATTYFLRYKVNVTTRVMTFKSYSSAANRTSDTSALLSGSITPSSNANNARYIFVWNDRPTNGCTMSGNIKNLTIGKQSAL